MTSVDILHQLPRGSVSSLSQTNKQLQAILEPSLYAHLDFNLPRTWLDVGTLGKLLVTSLAGLKFTTALAFNILDPDEGEVLAHKDEWKYIVEDDPSARLGSDSRHLGGLTNARSWKLATLFQILIQKLPRETLKCFR